MVKVLKFLIDNWKYFGAIIAAASTIFASGRLSEHRALQSQIRNRNIDSAIVVALPSLDNRMKSIERSLTDIQTQIQVYNDNQKAIQASYVDYLMRDRTLMKEDFYRLTRDLDLKKNAEAIPADTSRPRIKTIIQRIHE